MGGHMLAWAHGEDVQPSVAVKWTDDFGRRHPSNWTEWFAVVARKVSTTIAPVTRTWAVTDRA